MNLIDKTLLKFIFVGIVNTLFGSAIMFFLYNFLDLSYWFSSAMNYIAGSILSFFLNKYFTFAVKEWRIFTIIAFIMNILFCYLIAYGIAKPLINLILLNNSQKLRENIALLTGMVIFTGINYLSQKYIVFRPNKIT